MWEIVLRGQILSTNGANLIATIFPFLLLFLPFNPNPFLLPRLGGGLATLNQLFSVSLVVCFCAALRTQLIICLSKLSNWLISEKKLFKVIFSLYKLLCRNFGVLWSKAIDRLWRLFLCFSSLPVWPQQIWVFWKLLLCLKNTTTIRRFRACLFLLSFCGLWKEHFSGNRSKASRYSWVLCRPKLWWASQLSSFVFVVFRLVLDRVVENDFSEGSFFLGRVIEQFSGCGFQCKEKGFGF